MYNIYSVISPAAGAYLNRKDSLDRVASEVSLLSNASARMGRNLVFTVGPSRGLEGYNSCRKQLRAWKEDGYTSQNTLAL